MAKISGDNLKKILTPGFSTGGKGDKDPGTNPKKPGVPDYTPTVAKIADPRDALNINKSTYKRVMAISPFMTEDTAKSTKMIRYARRCADDCFNRNEAAIMMNLFYWSVGTYSTAIERDKALHAAMSWVPGMELLAVYVDFDITPAMQVIINVAETKGKKIEYRSIGATA